MLRRPRLPVEGAARREEGQPLGGGRVEGPSVREVGRARGSLCLDALACQPWKVLLVAAAMEDADPRALAVAARAASLHVRALSSAQRYTGHPSLALVPSSRRCTRRPYARVLLPPWTTPPFQAPPTSLSDACSPPCADAGPRRWNALRRRWRPRRRACWRRTRPTSLPPTRWDSPRRRGSVWCLQRTRSAPRPPGSAPSPAPNPTRLDV